MRGPCYDQYRLWDRQDKFSWAGIVSAGLAPFVSSGLSGKFGAAIGGFGRKLVANTASGIVGAAAESLISGADFGDNLIAALPSVIGNTVGNLVADGIAGRGRSGATGAGDASSTQPTTGEGGGQVGDSGDIVVTARRGGGYNPVAAAVAQTVAQTATGARAIDPFTGTARRIDSIVIRNGGVLDSVEVTSMTASKDA